MKFSTIIAKRIPGLLFCALLTGIVIIAVPVWGQVINEDTKLVANDGAAYDGFGKSVAIAGGMIAIGAWDDDDNGPGSGSAYVFDAATGGQLVKLLPNDGGAGEAFGISIAIDNGIVAVGAWSDGDSGTWSGSAYLFDASTGTQLFKLLSTDGAADDWFGSSIAIADGIVAVGAYKDDDNGTNSGSAYLFDASTGMQLFKLLPDDGSEDDEFGNSIAIAGGVVAVGAHQDNPYDSWSGSAYLFDASTGLQLAKLIPLDGEALDQFGESIDIDGDVVAVGARFGDTFGHGWAYLFDATSGAQTAKLVPADPAIGANFGMSVGIDNGEVVVGAFKDDDNGFQSGSAYRFDASSGAETAKLLPSDGASGDYFGQSIAIENGVVVVGALQDDDNGLSSGSAYVFGTPGFTSTVSAAMTCKPSSGTVPFVTLMTVTLNNLYLDQIRRVSAHLDVVLAGGAEYPNWRAGYTNVAAGSSLISSWNQNIPSLGAVIGNNVFTVVAQDVTPAPYNQPPYPPAGDTATAGCTVTGVSP